MFSKHEGLIKLLETYGFYCIGQKDSKNGSENVFYKHMLIDPIDHYNPLYNYPFIKITNTNKHLLSIYPKYHTNRTPNSWLHTKKHFEHEDVS